MYGKHFSSMYERSMVGSGAMVFAVMGYIISNTRPDKKVGGQVTLNPALLGPIFGEKPSDVEKAIEFLCKPDPKSSTKDEGGRRLMRLGEFDYRVVNYAKYAAIRNEDERREQNRANQAKFREKQKFLKNGKPLPGEVAYVEAVESGNQDAINRAEANGGIL